MSEINGVRVNILPSETICRIVREALYYRGEIAKCKLEEEKIALILEKIETDMNNAFILGFDMGKTQREI